MWVYLSLISAFFVALRYLAYKKGLQTEEELDFLLVNTIIGLFFVAPFFVFVKPIPLNVFFLIILMAIIDLYATILLFKSFKHAEISTVSPLLNLTPVFAIFIAFATLGEMPSMMQIAGIVITMLGIYILLIKSFKKLLKLYTKTQPKYIIYMVSAAFFFGVIGVIVRYALRFMSVYSFTVYSYYSFAALVIVYCWHKKKFYNIIPIAKRSWKIASYATFFALIGNIIINFALQIPEALVALVIPIRRVSTLFVVVIGGKMFKESDLIKKTIACAIMIIGIILIAS